MFTVLPFIAVLYYSQAAIAAKAQVYAPVDNLASLEVSTNNGSDWKALNETSYGLGTSVDFRVVSDTNNNVMISVRGPDPTVSLPVG
jgi:hypothetical protein